MGALEALILGIIQGLTEYLPVSSSGHLTIASNLLGMTDPDKILPFTILVHVATVLSTLVILRKEIIWIFKGLFKIKDGANNTVGGIKCLNDEQNYTVNILVSMIPVGIVGIFFKDFIEQAFSGLLIVGICLIVTALLLTFSYYAKPRQKENISILDAFIIGIAQAVACLPGLSRSGSTIATGLLLGDNKEKMAQFSFLMVIPPILGEALLDIKNIAEVGINASFNGIPKSSLIIGFITAFLFGCIACKWMINIVKKGKLIYFAIYCAIIGIVAIVANGL